MMMDFIIHNKGLVLTSAVVVSQCCGIIDLRRIFRWTKKLLAKSQDEAKKNQELKKSDIKEQAVKVEQVIKKKEAVK